MRATNFRRWSTAVLREFAIKGYVIDKKRMENGSFIGVDYFEHLLAEIREIRLSERRFYQKLTDIYATSIDYNVNAPTTKLFFQKVQNKIHYAVHGHTAAELIVERADSRKEHMGITTWENAPHGKIVNGLYVAGEAAGTFGVYRPGGSALNSTQVGSLRAAEHIVNRQDRLSSAPVYTPPTVRYGVSNITKIKNELQTEMSRVADFDRSTDGMKALLDRLDRLCGEFFETAIIEDRSQTAELLKLYDTVLTQRSVLSAMICSAEEIGTHGSAFIDRNPDQCGGVSRTTRTLTKGTHSEQVPVSPMPEPELWFETLLARKKQEMDDERK